MANRKQKFQMTNASLFSIALQYFLKFFSRRSCVYFCFLLHSSAFQHVYIRRYLSLVHFLFSSNVLQKLNRLFDERNHMHTAKERTHLLPHVCAMHTVYAQSKTV